MSVRTTSLPSGLAVVTEATRHLKTAAIGVFVAAGSRFERAGEHGLSHFIEHMAFKGTRRRSARDIAEAIENVGGDLNAETGVERTSYFARVLGIDAGLALDVIGDILTESAFDADELEREKNVIIQEIGAVEDTPDDWVFDLLTATAWPDQPIGRPILGTREGVGAFDRVAIDRYLGRRYSAGATVVAAAGAVEHDQIVDLVQSRLERLPPASAPAEAPAVYRGGETKLSRRLEQTHVVVGFEGRPAGAPDHDAAQVFAAAAGGGMSSRLFQEVREKRGLAYSIFGFHWDFIDTGLFGFYAGSADRDAAEVVAASLDCLAEAAHGLGEAEIRRAKAQMKVSLVTALEQPAARVHQLSRQMQVYGRPLSFDEMLARVDAITVEEVRKTGAAMLRSPPAVATIGAVGKVPGQAKVAGRFERGMMALFGLTRPVSPEPLLARRRRLSAPGGAVRLFVLVPAQGREPQLSRAVGADLAGRRPDPSGLSPAPSAPGRRHGSRRGLYVPHFRQRQRRTLGRDHARRGQARGVAERDPRLLDGRVPRRQGADDARRRGDGRIRLSRLRLHRIEAACIPENAPSIALLERNGFRREGYARGFLRINGAWRDHLLFALVESDARPRLTWTNLD